MRLVAIAILAFCFILLENLTFQNAVGHKSTQGKESTPVRGKTNEGALPASIRIFIKE